MATTTGSPWNLSYPEATDDVRPYEDIQELADDVHLALTTVNDRAVAPPRCQVRRNANQGIASGGTPSAFSFDVEDVDTDTMYTSGGNVTIKTAGRYMIIGSCTWALSATGDRVLGIWVNSGEVVGTSTIGSSANAVRQNLSEERVLAVNDVVQLRAYQNSGASMNVVGRLTVRRVADS